ncbi:hypothetical protein CK507_06475 [Pseudomonas sp. WN033]|nr:hypothetical protein CK507_06475 [Pseudomonas sp. WN033]
MAILGHRRSGKDEGQCSLPIPCLLREKPEQKRVFVQTTEKFAVAAGLGLVGTVGAQGCAPSSPMDGL